MLDAQRNLLHSVSHELRTPIARLEFAFELLRAAADDPALDQRIVAMEGDLAELNGLVNELLSMTRLEGGQPLHCEVLDPAQVLRQCAETLPPGQCALTVALLLGLGSIEADRRLLARAVGNLLRNAQKYGNQEIRLSARRRGPRSRSWWKMTARGYRKPSG
ncbi:HAMP domain-containing histidine kinase [Massilia sp. H-1]|nr:HAMP domain-containing histidine kinase [Massilia sp. H-1]